MLTIPQCSVCGRFTTYHVERVFTSPPNVGEDDIWYCFNHDPREDSHGEAPHHDR